MIETTLRQSMSPIRLSPSQVADYHQKGFILVEGIFPKDEIAAIDREIDRIREIKAEDGANQRDVMLRLGLKSAVTGRMCRDHRILALLEEIVKPGIAIYSAKLFEKRAYDRQICHWHQDDAYYQKHSSCACRMSAWIPLQDCTEDNGCVWVVPASHAKGLRPAKYLGKETGHCELAFAPGETEIPGAIAVPMKAGDVLLFHALTLHRSLANHSPAPRRAFIISYQDALTPRGNEDQHEILRAANEGESHPID